jgi:hypothetical protein
MGRKFYQTVERRAIRSFLMYETLGKKVKDPKIANRNVTTTLLSVAEFLSLATEGSSSSLIF